MQESAIMESQLEWIAMKMRVRTLLKRLSVAQRTAALPHHAVGTLGLADPNGVPLWSGHESGARRRFASCEWHSSACSGEGAILA